MPDPTICQDAGLWQSVLVGSFAVLGSLGGVIVTQMNASRLFREQQRLAAQSEVRRIVTDLVRTGQEWVGVMETLVPMYSRSSDKELLEFFDTESGKKLIECNAQLTRLFGEATLRVGDPVVLQPIAVAYKLYKDAPEAMEGVFPSRDRKVGEALWEEVRAALRHVWQFRNAMYRVEDAAAPLLRSSIEPRRHIPARVLSAIRRIALRRRRDSAGL